MVEHRAAAAVYSLNSSAPMREKKRMLDNSPERVAYDLLVAIAHAEHKNPAATSGSASWAGADRRWILDTYVECLEARKRKSA